MAHVPYRYITVKGDGFTSQVPITFPIFSHADIRVQYLTGSGPGWTYVSGSRILSFTRPLAVGEEVIIYRETSTDLRHKFSQGAPFRAKWLDEDLEQVLRVAEEARAAAGIGLGGVFNMKGFRIINLAPATLDSDAAQWGQVKAYVDSSVLTAMTQFFSAGQAGQTLMTALLKPDLDSIRARLQNVEAAIRAGGGGSSSGSNTDKFISGSSWDMARPTANTVPVWGPKDTLTPYYRDVSGALFARTPPPPYQSSDPTNESVLRVNFEQVPDTPYWSRPIGSIYPDHGYASQAASQGSIFRWAAFATHWQVQYAITAERKRVDDRIAVVDASLTDVRATVASISTWRAETSSILGNHTTRIEALEAGGGGGGGGTVVFNVGDADVNMRYRRIRNLAEPITHQDAVTYGTYIKGIDNVQQQAAGALRTAVATIKGEINEFAALIRADVTALQNRVNSGGSAGAAPTPPPFTGTTTAVANSRSFGVIGDGKVDKQFNSNMSAAVTRSEQSDRIQYLVKFPVKGAWQVTMEAQDVNVQITFSGPDLITSRTTTGTSAMYVAYSPTDMSISFPKTRVDLTRFHVACTYLGDI